MKATVTKPPVSATRVILGTGEDPLPPDSHPLASHSTPSARPPTPLEPHQELFSCPALPAFCKHGSEAPTTAQHPSPMQVRLKVGVTGRRSPNLLGAEGRHQAWSSLCEPPGLSLLQGEPGGKADNEQTVCISCPSLPLVTIHYAGSNGTRRPRERSQNRVGSFWWGRGEQSPQLAASSSHPGSCSLPQDPVYLGGGK